jgi:hypothetical protein
MLLCVLLSKKLLNIDLVIQHFLNDSDKKVSLTQKKLLLVYTINSTEAIQLFPDLKTRL